MPTSLSRGLNTSSHPQMMGPSQSTLQFALDLRSYPSNDQPSTPSLYYPSPLFYLKSTFTWHLVAWLHWIGSQTVLRMMDDSLDSMSQKFRVSKGVT